MTAPVGIVATIVAQPVGSAVAGPGPEVEPVTLGIFDGANGRFGEQPRSESGAHRGRVEPAPMTPPTYDWTNVDAQIVPARVPTLIVD